MDLTQGKVAISKTKISQEVREKKSETYSNSKKMFNLKVDFYLYAL